jgi:hypothetical protein
MEFDMAEIEFDKAEIEFNKAEAWLTCQKIEVLGVFLRFWRFFGGFWVFLVSLWEWNADDADFYDGFWVFSLLLSVISYQFG